MSFGGYSDDEETECPLCMEEIDITDRRFKPCPCGYQICRFCWHHIKENLNGLCPACRRQYSENQVEFKPMSAEEVAALKAAKRAKEREKKEQEAVAKKHMANMRIVQKNLVYVLGLSPRLASEEILRQHDFFGQFGPIKKIVISRRGGNSLSATSSNQNLGVYITFNRKEDAIKAIEAVEGSVYDGRMLRATHGTTKYCQNFLKNVNCTNPQCMFLHEIGESAENGDIGEGVLNLAFRGSTRTAPFPPLNSEKKEEKPALPASATWAKPQRPGSAAASGKITPTEDYPSTPTTPIGASPTLAQAALFVKEKKRGGQAKAEKPAPVTVEAAPQNVSGNASSPEPEAMSPISAEEERADLPQQVSPEEVQQPAAAPTPVVDFSQSILSSLTNFGLGSTALDASPLLSELQPRYNGSFNPFEDNEPLSSLRGPFSSSIAGNVGEATPAYMVQRPPAQQSFPAGGYYGPGPLAGVPNTRPPPPGFGAPPALAGPAKTDFDPFRDEVTASARLPPPPGVAIASDLPIARKASGGSRFERFFEASSQRPGTPEASSPVMRSEPLLDPGAADRRFAFPVNGTLFEQQAYANRVAMAQQRYFQMVGHQPTSAAPPTAGPPGIARSSVSQFENATTADDFLNQFLINARMQPQRPPGIDGSGVLPNGIASAGSASSMPFRDPAIMAMSMGGTQQGIGNAPRPPVTLPPPPGVGDPGAAAGRSRLRIFDDLVRPPNQPFLKAPTNGAVSSSGLSAVPVQATLSESAFPRPVAEQVFQFDRPEPAPPDPFADSWGSPPKTPMRRLDPMPPEHDRWDASSVEESRGSETRSRRDTLSTTPGSLERYSPVMDSRDDRSGFTSPVSELLAESDIEDEAVVVHVPASALKPHEPIDIPAPRSGPSGPGVSTLGVQAKPPQPPVSGSSSIAVTARQQPVAVKPSTGQQRVLNVPIMPAKQVPIPKTMPAPSPPEVSPPSSLGASSGRQTPVAKSPNPAPTATVGSSTQAKLASPVAPAKKAGNKEVPAKAVSPAPPPPAQPAPVEAATTTTIAKAAAKDSIPPVVAEIASKDKVGKDASKKDSGKVSPAEPVSGTTSKTPSSVKDAPVVAPTSGQQAGATPKKGKQKEETPKPKEEAAKPKEETSKQEETAKEKVDIKKQKDEIPKQKGKTGSGAVEAPEVKAAKSTPPVSTSPPVAAPVTAEKIATPAASKSTTAPSAAAAPVSAASSTPKASASQAGVKKQANTTPQPSPQKPVSASASAATGNAKSPAKGTPVLPGMSSFPPLTYENVQQARNTLAANLSTLAANLNLGDLGASDAQSVASLAALGIDANAFIDQALESLAATAAMLAPALEAHARNPDMAASQLGNKWTQDEWKSKVRSVEAVMSRVKEARDLRKKQLNEDPTPKPAVGKGKGTPAPAKNIAPTPAVTANQQTVANKVLQNALLSLEGNKSFDLSGLTKEDLNILTPLVMSLVKGKDGGAAGEAGSSNSGDMKQILASVENIMGDFVAGAGNFGKVPNGEASSSSASTVVPAVAGAPSGSLPPSGELGTLQRQLSDGMQGVEKSLQEFNALFGSLGAAISGANVRPPGSPAGTPRLPSSPSNVANGTNTSETSMLDAGALRMDLLERHFAPAADDSVLDAKRAKAIEDLQAELAESQRETSRLEAQLRKLAEENSNIISLIFQSPGDPEPSVLRAGLVTVSGSDGPVEVKT